jgi:predicted CoA-substrate-specific enzyme activase
MLQLGIDVGSTTAKAVVMENDGTILWKEYRRHNAKQPETVREYLLTIEKFFPDRRFNLFITGSGGRSIAPHINARYIQEVNAVTFAVEMLHPDTGSVIELGGQDAKVIIWKEDEQGRKTTLTYMNDKCAGGTGATIDKIFGKIGITAEEAGRIRTQGKTVHHVAAKCGVFAETDVVGLLKAGVDKEEIIVSLCTAIVKQNLEVLVRGNVLRDKVLLLGGPHTFLPLLAEIWRDFLPQTWQIHEWKPAALPLDELIHVPTDAHYFAAIGAVLYGRRSEELFSDMHHGAHSAEHIYTGTDALDRYISQGRIAQLRSSGAVRDGLVGSDEEVAQFARLYAMPTFTPPDFARGTVVPVYIGIDGGSTSTKLAVLDTEGVLIYKDYVLSQGNPIIDVREMFTHMRDWCRERGVTFETRGTGVTGYAAALLSQAFSIDLAVVETVAHMRAAVTYHGDVDIICDVGGQDIKVLFMKHGRVVDFKLNTQCSAGNGYFLQSMAQGFGIDVADYAAHAFKARSAPAFNYGCAVFMEQDKVNFQQLGWDKDEIMAGLALVLPLNIWNYVVQETNIARLGKRMVLQGGTQKNLAAVKAQVDFVKSKVPDAVVSVHRYADICGAIGAALEARSHMQSAPTTFMGIDAAAAVTFTARNDASTRCRFCVNHCPRTFIDIQVKDNKEVRFISGYTCEKGMADNVVAMKAREQEKQSLLACYPNLVEKAAAIVFDDYAYEPLPVDGALVAPGSQRIKSSRQRFERSGTAAAAQRAKMVVAMPRLLNMYFYAPFFSTYFRTLGVERIVWSDYTSAQLWSEGNKWGAIDPCFPAKVAPAHIYNLLQKTGVTQICFPRITHLQSHVVNTLGENACVIQMGTPEVTHAVFTREKDFFAGHNIDYWKPLVSFNRVPEVKGMMFDYFAEKLAITSTENDWAVAQGYAAMNAYFSILRTEGKAIINNLIDADKIGIVMIGHPYHHDPGLNHGILDEFRLRGFPVLCIESLPVDDEFIGPLFGGDNANDPALDGITIKDVWMRNFNRNTNLKMWAAKIVARHPNLAAIDLSSFKCGHDAPTYSYIDNIMDASATPHFLFHDIDQNKPGATFKIRIQTIEYFLRLEEERLANRAKEHRDVA